MLRSQLNGRNAEQPGNKKGTLAGAIFVVI